MNRVTPSYENRQIGHMWPICGAVGTCVADLAKLNQLVTFSAMLATLVFIDDLKTTLGMAVFTTLSPAMIRSELLVQVIAYNLLRALMMHGKSSGREEASFKGTIDRLNHWLPAMLSSNSTTVRRLVTDLFELVAEDQVPSRPFRRNPEP